MPWEEGKEHRTNSPLPITFSPTGYNDQRHKPVRRSKVKRQPISISSLPLPSFSPNTKRYIKSLTPDDGNNNLGKSDITPQKRIGNNENLPVASRRKLMDVFGDSGIENSVNATPTKDKPQTNQQNNRTPLGNVNDTSTTPVQLNFAAESNVSGDELYEKVAAEKKVVGNDIVRGVAAAATVASSGGVNLFGKDKGLDSSLSSLQDELSIDEEEQDLQKKNGLSGCAIGVLGNDSNEFKPTSVQEELNRAGAAADAAVDSSGIVPADNRDPGDGKGLKSDEVRDEMKSGKESGSAAASVAVNPPSEALCDVGENLSADVNESEAASPKQQLAVVTVVNEPRRSRRLDELPSKQSSNDEEVGRDADSTSRAAANEEDSLSEESRNNVQETRLPTVPSPPASGASAPPHQGGRDNLENFDIWQHKYHSAGSAEALVASLLETLPPVDVDRIMNWEKNDSIRRVFTGTSQIYCNKRRYGSFLSTSKLVGRSLFRLIIIVAGRSILCYVL